MIFLHFCLFYFSGVVVFSFFFVARTSIIFKDLVDGFLIVINLLKERFQIGKLHLRFSREIENSFTNDRIQTRASDRDLKYVAATMQFDFEWNFYAIDSAIVVVEHFLIHSGDGGGFFRDEMSLRVKENIALQSCGRCEFDLKCVAPANLRVTDERKTDFVLF